MSEDVTADDRRKPWTADQMRTAARLYQDLFVDRYGEDGPGRLRRRVFVRIGATIGRTWLSVEVRCNVLGASFGLAIHRGRGISHNAATDRAERAEANDRRDLTGIVFGDPPPGYSALDRRRAGMRR